jgi:hypothetical protein
MLGRQLIRVSTSKSPDRRFPHAGATGAATRSNGVTGCSGLRERTVLTVLPVQLESSIARCQEHTDAWNANRQAAHRNPAVKAVHDDVIGHMPIIEQFGDDVFCDDASEAIEAVGTASLLMRILDRVEGRLGRERLG